MHRKPRDTIQEISKGRAGIGIHVEVKDGDGSITLSGDYNWFVQAIE